MSVTEPYYVSDFNTINLPEIVSEDQFRLRFQDWCKKHGKTYSSAEETEHRFQVFKQNYEFIRQHNANPNALTPMGLTGLADLTYSEYKAMFVLCPPFSVLCPDFSQPGRTTTSGIPMDVPDSIDGEE